MRKRLYRLIVILLLINLFFPIFIFAETQRETATFTAPAGWKPIKVSPDKGVYQFLIGEPQQGLTAIFRILRSPNQTALQWAIDEEKEIKSQGIITQSPKEVSIEDLIWTTLESNIIILDQKGGMKHIKNKQYFVKGKYDALVEVAIIGEKDNFTSAIDKEINDLLLSVKLFNADLFKETKKQDYAKLISDEYKEANKIFPKAIKLVNEGKLDEGLELLKQTIIVAPEEPDIHMNYASVLFVKGQQILQAGDKENGRAIFNEIENELLLAIKLYKDKPSKDKDNSSKAQCAFLLGDIYFYVYEDKDKAKALYQKALEYYPEHSGAMESLKSFNK